MPRRILLVVVILVLLASASLAVAREPSPGASPMASPQASPFGSPVSLPVGMTSVEPEQATVAALSTQLVTISLTATARAVTQATVSALSTQVAAVAITATAGAMPAPTNTPLPTATATPTPTPTPLPKPGTVLYQADAANGGLDAWSGPGWKHVKCMLVNDCSVMNSFISAPFEVQFDEYAVEAEIQIVGGGDNRLGVFARGSDDGSYICGYDVFS